MQVIEGAGGHDDNDYIEDDDDDDDDAGQSRAAILLSGIGARGVSSKHMENMEMFSCSPT